MMRHGLSQGEVRSLHIHSNDRLSFVYFLNM